jgi:hypothetical protein
MILLIAVIYILIGIVSGIVIFKRAEELKTVKELIMMIVVCAFLWIIVFIFGFFEFICNKYGERITSFLNSEIKKYIRYLVGKDSLRV